MILTIRIRKAELERVPGLERQLRDLSINVKGTGVATSFIPKPGNLVQFINLVAALGISYEVAGQIDTDSTSGD